MFVVGCVIRCLGLRGVGGSFRPRLSRRVEGMTLSN